MGRRSRPDPQTVLTAYNASHNMRSLCAGLGLNPTSDTTAKRICAEHNLPVPPVHWSARPAFDDLSGEAAPPVESPEDEHVHDRTMTRHPLCAEGLALGANPKAGHAATAALAERLAALFAALKPMETFANEAAGDACEAERARVEALRAGEALPLRPIRVKGGIHR